MHVIKKDFQMTDKKLKIEFAPGCFDQFDGTQEELDELMAEIQAAMDSGELFENSVELTDEAFEELPDEVKIQLIESLQNIEDPDFKRKLQ